MLICEHCNRQADVDSARCPHCLWWSEGVLVRLLQHEDARVREQAGLDAVFVERTPRLIRTLATALRDKITAVRQQACVALFICGREAAIVVPELIEALTDHDIKVRRVAAASLSMIGPPARLALPTLASIRDTEDEQLRGWIQEAERAIVGE
jgi:HEAT repeat protein